MVPHSKEQQDSLKEMIEGSDGDASGEIDFYEFLSLVRKFHDLADVQEMVREKQAMAQTNFTDDETREFREIFEDLVQPTDAERAAQLEAAAAQSGKLSGGGVMKNPGLTVFGLKMLLRSAGVQPTAAEMQELKVVFDQFSRQEGGASSYERSIDFPEFLLLMHHILEVDFAGIQDHAKHTVVRRDQEKETMEGLLMQVEKQKLDDRVRFSDMPTDGYCSSGSESGDSARDLSDLHQALAEPLLGRG